MAAFMADKVGCMFDARISGVTRFGLFVTLTDTGASGMIPLSSLPDDFWMHDEPTQSLSGRRSRMVFHLAQPVTVRLAEARPVTGGLLFQVGAPGAAAFRGQRMAGSGAARRPSPHASAVKRQSFVSHPAIVEPSRAGGSTEQLEPSLAGSVYAAAFAFMAPRTLTAIPLSLS